ncbi:MAG: hypothetical protein HW407_1368, partial [Bacteroidetes bacterium]|nr:hypothetical protein [Bacteroidota bacterium]
IQLVGTEGLRPYVYCRHCKVLKVLEKYIQKRVELQTTLEHKRRDVTEDLPDTIHEGGA